MAAINFPTATSNGQTFTADTGVIYTYIGTPPNGFWSGTFGTTGLATLDGRFVALNDGNSIQTMQTQGLKFNNGSADTILLDGVNGKVGIGTTSPGAALQIKKTSAGSDPIHLLLSNSSESAGTTSSIYFAPNVVGSIRAAAIKGVNEDGGNSTALTFFTNPEGNAPDERMRIDSSGRVGIGTTSPSAPLDVVGNDGIAIQSSAQTNEFLIRPSGSSADGIRFTQAGGGGDRIVIDSSGKVGIGETTPSANLIVKQSGSTFTAQSQTVALFQRSSSSGHGAKIAIVAGNNANSDINFGDTDNEDVGIIQYFHSDNSFRFRTNAAASPAMLIDSSGKVGIGTTSPSEKFVVSNGGNEGFEVVPASASNLNVFYNYNRNTNAYIDVRYLSLSHQFWTGSSSSEAMRIDSSGRLLVGTTTEGFATFGDNLTIADSGHCGVTIRSGTSSQGNIYFSDGSSGGSEEYEGIIQYLHDVDAMAFGVNNGSEAMRINSSGNMGIGTTSPGCKLEVYRSGSGDCIKFGKQTIYGKFHADGQRVGFIGNRDSDNKVSGFFIENPGNTGTSNFDALTFKTVNDERMRIDSSGNVGIGTNSPQEIVHIKDVGSSNVVTTRIQQSSNNTQTDGGAVLELGGTRSDGSDGFYGGIKGGRENQALHNAGYLALLAGDNDGQSLAERMRIDSSGRVGIGTTSPSGGLHISKDIEAQLILQRSTTTTGASFLRFTNGGGNYYIGPDSSTGGRGTAVGGAAYGLTFTTESARPIVFATNNTERMRIQTNGKVSLGTNYSTASRLTLRGNWGYGVAAGQEFYHDGTIPGGGRADVIYFIYQNSVVGKIDMDTNDTAYRTTSDYRLKENQVIITDGIPRLKQLNPYRFNWIATPEKTVDGFFAHEAQLVVPEAVSGTHNEIDGDGNPVMQSIDQAKLVPLLTAALQEAIGRIETLEAEVAALKAG